MWNFKGEVIHAGVNYPGSWRDSRVASCSNFTHSLTKPKNLPPEHVVLEDSAFPCTSKDLIRKIVRARKEDQMETGGDVPE